MAGSTHVYPIRNPVVGHALNSVDAPTGRVDYLKIERFRVNYEDSPNGYGGDNLPGNKASIIVNKTKIYIAMPQALNVAYQTDYNAINMGTVGVAAAQIAAGLTGPGGADTITNAIQTAAAAGLPEFAYNKGASLAQGVAGALGMETGVTGNALQALTKGRIMNPFTEQIFNGVQFRNHQFTFKMFARNKQEAREILSIIKYLKQGALPTLGDISEEELTSLKNSSGKAVQEAAAKANNGKVGTTPDQAINYQKTGKFLNIPDRFQLTFVRYDLSSDRVTVLPHYKFQPCVCTNVSVNYTPDGQYVSFKDGIAELTDNIVDGPSQMLVPAVEVGLGFAETRFVTAPDARAGY